MEVRQISNRKNKICLRVGIGMCIISAIEMLLIKFYFKSKWTGRNVDLFFIAWYHRHFNDTNSWC